MAEERSNMEAVKDAMVAYEKFCKENTMMGAEIASIKINGDNKPSTIKYDSPDGTFTIKYNPIKKEATATAEFVTGSYKSVVTEDGVKEKGTAPVYHPHFGVFYHAFHKEDE